MCYLTIRAGEGNVGKGLFTFYIRDGASTVMEQGARSRAWGGVADTGQLGKASM